MTASRDLVVSVADKDMKATVLGILGQPKRLGIRPVSIDVVVNTERDPGSRVRSHLLLRSYATTHAYALVVFDHQGCGREQASPEDLEVEVERLMASTGWAERSATVVIAPELENWVWSQSPHVASVLGWSGRQPTIDEWLRSEGRLGSNGTKPVDPKAAVDDALRIAGVRKSSALYGRLADQVGFERCTDRAFGRLRDILRGWFPA